jgi:hypothetical protein
MVNIIETGTSNYGFFFRYGDNTVTGRQIALHYLPPGIIVADFQNVNMYGSSSIALNKWVHVAFVVTGSGYVNQCYLYKKHRCLHSTRQTYRDCKQK